MKWHNELSLIILTLVAPLVAGTSTDRLRAFPGAEGFGSYAAGGRGGKVYEVTSLDDSGLGSLRAAVEAQEPRIIVFRVSGTIALRESLVIKEPYITIAGQTAPGDGICLKNFPLIIATDHVIVRYLRCRPGDDMGKEVDALSITAGKNIIVDHCSASWSVDETLSSSTGGQLGNVTVQWCMITESLDCSVHHKGCHGYGSLIRGGWGNGYSFHHNLYAHHRARLPRPGNYNARDKDPYGLIFDFRNNIIYNWAGSYAGYNSDGADGTDSITKMNFVGNYYKKGPNSTGNFAFREATTSSQAYFDGNCMNGIIPRDPWSLVNFRGFSESQVQTYKQSKPIRVATVTTDDAITAYERVLGGAGAIYPVRDDVDTRVINHVINGTGSIINDENEVGGWPELKSTAPPPDSDHDGIPDDWEREIGLDPNDVLDGAKDRNGDGYTNIEEYLNWLAADPNVLVKREAYLVSRFTNDASRTSLPWTAADNFVPFVIPARPDLSSPMAIVSFEPIQTGTQRLVASQSFFYHGDKRVRLWGVNFSSGANLPKHEDAPHIAARLAAAGVNAVRCHHMDTSRWPRGLWNATDGKSLEPEALDRLDYFIDQLARHGIWVNINLHVGRTHSQYLGLPETNRNYDKTYNIFTPALIDAQKQYARDLLTHVNQYRQVRYADDPAVAIVEITNENSFFMWDGEQALRTMPPYYANILQDKLNNWLKMRYGSTEMLRSVWAEGTQPLGQNLLTNGNFETVSSSGIPKSWNLEQHSGCSASLSRYRYQDQVGLRIEIGKADGTDWHLQLNQTGLSIKEGQYYTVIFQAAAVSPRRITCNVGQAHSPWNNLGLSKQVELTSGWQSYRFGFVANADDYNARVNFAVGGSQTTVYLANVEFRPGGQVVLQAGESIEAGSVALFADNETPARTIDRMRFLAETEKAYFDDMRNFVKNELGCKALVTGTIVFGPLGLYTQSDMDFIDTHAYWQHPRFPGKPWDSNNWLIEQKAMTDYPSQATLFRLAAERLAGKPITCTEYNHPAPLDAQAECVPMIASFAAAQDWDGVWLYTYSHASDEWYREYMNSYFDIDTNPAKWGFMRAGTAIFRDHGIIQLNNLIVVPLADPADLLAKLAKLHLEHDRDMFAVLAERAAIGWQDMLEQQIFSSLSGEVNRQGSSNQQKLTWSIVENKGFFAARGSAALSYTGHAERFEEATDGQISIAGPAFVAMTVTALDKMPLNQSQKILITACGRCENVGMKFSRDRRTVGTNWGGPPVQIEAVEGTMLLPQGQWICHALGPDGLPRYNVPVSYKADQGIIQLLPKYETMWYLLTR